MDWSPPPPRSDLRAARRRREPGAVARAAVVVVGRAVVAVLGVALGAATWRSWLGWDHTASYDPVTGTVQDPYVTLQVLGCALTVGAVAASFGALGRPVEGAGGVALGFWVPWTLDAIGRDDSGLAVVGAEMMAVGLVVGTGVAALAGMGIRRAVRAARRRRRAASWHA